MGSKELRKRDIWQDISGSKAAKAELDFFSVFSEEFKGTPYRIRAKPKEFKNIYVDVELSDEELAAIYTPDEPIRRHGLRPDYAIDNTEKGKTIYVEVKRQDGWVEGGKRSDGRGNAHERSCKYSPQGYSRFSGTRATWEPTFSRSGQCSKETSPVTHVG